MSNNVKREILADIEELYQILNRYLDPKFPDVWVPCTPMHLKLYDMKQKYGDQR